MQHRASLARDKRYWGEAVFARLAPELLAHPAGIERIPTEGFMAIWPGLVLAALAEVSERCRQRCLHFAHAQRALVEASLRGRAAAGITRASELELQGSLRALRTMLAVLSKPQHAAPHARASEIEAWLAL
jgi:hypothetical protein